MDASDDTPLLGCDFTSSPSRQKPIVLAFGRRQGLRVELLKIERFSTLQGWIAALRSLPSWVGAFDLPFGLPRALVQSLGWPTDWTACMRHYAQLPRAEIRAHFAAYCQARPKGAKFAHRACDGPAGSSPSMKWVNPPVAWMMHAGVPALWEAAASMPGLTASPAHTPRIALEAYPGYLAHAVLGRQSYKADDRARQTPERHHARRHLINALLAGQHPMALALEAEPAQQQMLVDDPRGDALDSVLALLQAAWAHQQHHAGHPCWGLPSDIDPLEGWIVGVPAPV